MLVDVFHSASLHRIYLIWLLAFLSKFTIVQATGQPAHRRIQYWFGLYGLCSRLLRVRIRFTKRRQILLRPLRGAVLHSILLVSMLMCS